MKVRAILLPLSVVLFFSSPLRSESAGETASRILAATGVKGGVIVHLGCREGKLAPFLRANDSYVVEGLEADSAKAAAARRYIKSLGLYGPVSVHEFSGRRLPYIDDSVNLLVAEALGPVSMDEVMRVLVPRGVAYIKKDGAWTKIVKPWPRGKDEWTHYLHDPTNNAVAHDSFIEPVTRYQWVGTPRYSRHHDHMSSVSAAVTAGGRVFYIIDEAPRAFILIPPKWRLVARDSFNGTVLWKRRIERWHEHLWPLKSGPQLLPRRLVAVGDRVYVTLSIDGPLTALDAATGKTVRTYEGTKATEEILYSDGTLFLSVAAEGQPLRSDPERVYPNMNAIRADIMNPLWTDAPRSITAVNAASGAVLWKKVSNVVSLSLAADKEGVYFHDGERIVCLNRNDGTLKWTSEPLPRKKPMRSSGGVTLVVCDGVVLYDGQVPPEKDKPRWTALFALSAKDGKLLWKAPHPPCGHQGTPPDILVAGGLVWTGAVAVGRDSGVMIGRDLRTGEVKSEFLPDVETHWFHHRCYRAKATDKYLLFSRTGIEFIDWAGKHWIPHHWVRGACLYGIMPANGLIYAPEHPCACYLEAKLFGFSALAPPSKNCTPRRDIPDSERLARGPAFGREPKARSGPEDWPTYRHDAARSGAASTVVPARGLKTLWTAAVGGRITSPVISGGKLFVSSIDAHTLYALDVANGNRLWEFTAGGRVDSPPTVWRGRVLFGCRDGYVYCLDETDGSVMWRFRAAPEKLRLGAFEQVESVWPVHGAVLIQGGVLYCVAGRSMFLDGGLRFLRLDPETGRKLSETVLDRRIPDTGAGLQTKIKALNMPVALPDVLSSDGKYVYMRSLPFDLEGRRKFVEYIPVTRQQGDDVHLFSPTGFLDDTMWHRTYWVYGRAWASGAGGYYRAGRVVPSGRILAFDDKNVYGFGRWWRFYRWTTPIEFELFAADKHARLEVAGVERKPKRKAGKVVGRRTVNVTRFERRWAVDLPVQVNSLVLTPEVLFAAGPPDTEDELYSFRHLADEDVIEKLREQEAALEGRRGAFLVAVSRKDGKKISAYKLEVMPRFDGMIAARKRLFVTTIEGTILCLGTGEGSPLPRAPEIVVKPRPKEAGKPLLRRQPQGKRKRPRRKRTP